MGKIISSCCYRQHKSLELIFQEKLPCETESAKTKDVTIQPTQDFAIPVIPSKQGRLHTPGESKMDNEKGLEECKMDSQSH